MFFHGNAEDIGQCYKFCKTISSLLNVNVLAVEYPGYGVCGGTPSEENVLKSAVAGLNFLSDILKISGENIMIFGRSIGTGPAVYLSTLHKFAGLILVAPFLSVRKVAFSLLKSEILSNLLVENLFPNCERIQQNKCKTLIIHGEKDRIVPSSHGKLLYNVLVKNSKEPVMFVNPKDMEHNTNLLTNDDYFLRPMWKFFELQNYVFRKVLNEIKVSFVPPLITSVNIIIL